MSIAKLIDSIAFIGRDLGLTTSNQNRAFHKRANMKMSGPPKPTHMDKDLSRDATNVISGTKVSQRPLAPNANSQSRNGA